MCVSIALRLALRQTGGNHPVTFKQLEALYWIVQLGTFAHAAQRLHASQSAISKRIGELEALFDTELFDRRQRSARLTEKGEEMFLVAKTLIEERDAALERLGSPEVSQRRVRIGVTELTAMTWLPRLVAGIQGCLSEGVNRADRRGQRLADRPAPG